MCGRHPLSNKNECEQFDLTIKDYESKYAEIEEKYIRLSSDNNQTELSDEYNDLVFFENYCIYRYNTELLFHLLTCKRRIEFKSKFYEDPYVTLRTLSMMVFSGEHSREDIKKIINLYYTNHVKISVDFNNEKEYTSFEEFKEYLADISVFSYLVLEKPKLDNRHLVYSDLNDEYKNKLINKYQNIAHVRNKNLEVLFSL